MPPSRPATSAPSWHQYRSICSPPGPAATCPLTGRRPPPYKDQRVFREAEEQGTTGVIRSNTPAGADDPLWYKDAVLYEVHVRAFADGNGDGIGDFRGLLGKLDYL